MKTIFHFLLSEKIVADVIGNFEETESNNYFIFFDDISNRKVKFPKTKNDILVLNYLNSGINDLIEKLQPDLLLLHSISFKFAKVALEIKSNLKIGWFPWGYDIYSLPKIRLTLYGKKTLNYLNDQNPFFYIKNKIIEYCFDYLPDSILKKMNLEYFRETLLLHHKITYFISYIEEDFHLFSKYYPNAMKFIFSPFLTLNQYLGNIEQPELYINTGNILIGNSASLESNYFDVIEDLKVNKSKFYKAFFVLNYGETFKNFKKDIQIEINKELSEKADCITEFMDLKTYVEFLKSCNTAVFLHYRQQAMGNIITLIYLGARVYLSKHNPILHFFNSKGIKINIFENEFEEFGTSDLSNEEKEANRTNINKIFSFQNSGHIYTNVLAL